jgi:hypothetical protein
LNPIADFQAAAKPGTGLHPLMGQVAVLENRHQEKDYHDQADKKDYSDCATQKFQHR